MHPWDRSHGHWGGGGLPSGSGHHICQEGKVIDLPSTPQEGKVIDLPALPLRKERSLTYQHPPPQTYRHYAQAGGMHPTGMHSCY